MGGRCAVKRGFAPCALLLLLLAGCNDDSGGPNAINVGENQPVNLGLSSFRVEDNLQWTVYQPFFRALAPHAGEPDADRAEAEAIIASIGEVMQPFTHWQGDDGAADYASVRNPIDLMTQVLYTDRVENFRAGRESIAQAIDEGNPARYRNDRIIFSTREQTEEGTAASPWSYILAWVHITDAEGDDPTAGAGEDLFNREISNAVIRVILALNAPGTQISIYPAAEFNTMGEQTTPDASITSFTLPAEAPTDANPKPISPAATLNQSWLDHEDLWTWTSEGAVSFGSLTNVRCAHLRVRYDIDRAELYTSEQPSRVGLEGADPEDVDDGSDDAENPLCGALDANGDYGTPTRSWALDSANALDRQ